MQLITLVGLVVNIALHVQATLLVPLVFGMVVLLTATSIMVFVS